MAHAGQPVNIRPLWRAGWAEALPNLASCYGGMASTGGPRRARSSEAADLSRVDSAEVSLRMVVSAGGGTTGRCFR